MMMENPDYLIQINNLPGHWWDIDQDGFITSRKIQLQIELTMMPEASISAVDLHKFEQYGQMWQSVANYQVPQSVLNRIATIIATYPNPFSTDNMYIQNLNNGTSGIVNCDFFPVKITTLPVINGTTITPEALLEYFGKNINSLLNSNLASFSPYNYGGVNDNALYNQSYAGSLTSLVHINMVDDWTVILSQYDVTPSTSKFMFSTMRTPYYSDGFHPVSGNRRFGIYSTTNGEHVFYTMGVDRITTTSGTVGSTLKDIFTSSGLEDADELWRSMQDAMVTFINANGGNASKFGNPEVIARTQWALVKQFLKGQVNYQQFKNSLE